jgi:hypothetical protein
METFGPNAYSSLSKEFIVEVAGWGHKTRIKCIFVVNIF